jgi:hypothetical protein
MSPEKYPRWVYVLPSLHLCACLTLPLAILTNQGRLGVIWVFIMLVDLPVSFPAYALAWWNGLVAATWIFVVGTWWWYFLSRLLFSALRRLRDHRHRNVNSVTRLDK